MRPRHLFHRLHFQRDLHLAHGGEGVDQHRDAVALRLLEQQRGAALLHGAVGKFGDFEDRVHFEGNALQFLVLLQRADEVAQIAIGHKYEYIVRQSDGPAFAYPRTRATSVTHSAVMGFGSAATAPTDFALSSTCCWNTPLMATTGKSGKRSAFPERCALKQSAFV